MCLGIPGRVVAMVEGYADQLAVVDVLGKERRINVDMLEGERVSPGDGVLIHMGFARETIDEGKATEALAGLQMMDSGSEPPRA